VSTPAQWIVSVPRDGDIPLLVGPFLFKEGADSWACEHVKEGGVWTLCPLWPPA
jgi:hypothetical protein